MNLRYSLQKIKRIFNFFNFEKYYIFVKNTILNNNKKCLKKNFIAMKLYAKNGRCH